MNGLISVFEDGTQPTQKFDGISSGAFDSRYVRVLSNLSPWAESGMKRLDKLMRLERNWDGYNALAISFPIAFFALNLIDRLFVDGVVEPSIVPGSDGTLQLEWHVNQYDVELDILGVNNIVATRVNCRTGVVESVPLKNNFVLALDWVNALKFAG